MNWRADSWRTGGRWSSVLSSASSQRQKGEDVAGLPEPCALKVAGTIVCPAKADTFSGSLASLLPTGGLGAIRMSNKPLKPDIAHCRAGMAELLTEAVATTRNPERRIIVDSREAQRPARRKTRKRHRRRPAIPARFPDGAVPALRPCARRGHAAARATAATAAAFRIQACPRA